MNDLLKEIESELSGKITNKVHLRVQQRNAKKRTTTVEGLDKVENTDIKRLLTEMKKRFSCGGNIEKSKEHGTVIKLTGDQRETVKNYLIRLKMVELDDIVIHG